ncbi:MAG: efflux RND transporter permease subunit [Candidatus Aminicenantes bacterium]|nr:efflux RND transporter permease subunit [Candidatus Aminicenantes bacterium]NLH77367.1 efflux RND transporter permease subunit [Acidobacteriota bacterium]
MKLARIAVDRPVTMYMFYFAVILLGAVSLRELAVDLLPDISYPRLSVVTNYPGVAPEEIETLITAPLESAVSRVPGLRRVESVSKEGVSLLTLEFDWGTDMDFTMLHTREQLDNAKDRFPEDAESPTIVPLDPQSRPIMTLALSGDRTLLELKELAEELIKPRLEQIEGVGSAEITGGVEREIHIEADPAKLALYGLTIEAVAARVDAFNRNLQGGTIRKGTFKYALRVVGEFESLDEIGEIGLLVTEAGGVVRLRDVAAVRDSVKERQGMTRLDGAESIGLLVRKESGANTVKVTKLVRETIAQVRAENPGLTLSVVSEQAKAIESAIGAVKSELWQGAVLAFLTLLVFLQEWKTPLIIGTVIPVSIVGAFSLLFFGNITLNIMSLGGLALAVGMLDDCAVVVSENIFRHRSLGKGLKEAAYDGTREVGPAVVSTALTTIVVFLPVIYVHGVAGQLFKDTALTVTFALLASLLVSLTLIATLESRAFDLGVGKEGRWRWTWGLRKFPVAERPLYALFKAVGFVLNALASFLVQLAAFAAHYLALPSRPVLKAVFAAFNKVYERFVAGYVRFLRWSLDHKGRIVAWTLVFFAVTFALGGLIRRELMPPMETTAFELDLRMPVDFSFEQTTETAVMLESRLRGHPTVKTVLSQVGIVSGLESADPTISVNSARLFVEVRRPKDLEAALDAARTRLAQLPDIAYTVVREESAFNQFLALSGAEIGLQIKGKDLDRLKDIAADLTARLAAIPGIADVATNIGEGKPEFKVTVDKDSLKRYPGLSPATIGDFLVSAVRGRVATQFREMEKKYDILVRLEDASRENIEALLGETLPFEGRAVPLRDLVSYEIVRGPREIRRENQQRMVLVSANLKGRKLSQVTPAVDRAIAALRLPSDYRVTWSGEREEMARSFRSLVMALVLAALLTYMIMAAQFESLVHPFIVMFTLPMGAAGAIVALLLTGGTFNVISIIGLVVLVGIVVDNATVKIDYTNQLRRGGMPLRQAVEEGSHVRLRPILMSTGSTLVGLIPMALALERGAELMQPLAVVVIGGLLFSTFLTLILIPVIYEWVEARKG